MTATATVKHTPGPWSACREGDCSCKIVSCGEHPIATVVSGEWGDDYPSVRLVGDSLERRAEAYMEQITYGSVDPQVAKANAHLIAAAPDMLAALKGIVAEDAVDVFDSLRPEWQAVVLAIAKAEGRAS